MKPSIVELIFYTLVNILPLLTLALTPFREHMRLSRRWTAVLAVALCVVDGALSWLSVYLPGRGVYLTLAAGCCYLAFYLSAVRSRPLKLLVVLLILMNYASLASVTADFLVGCFMPGAAQHLYSGSYTFFYALGLLLAYPFYYQTLNLRIRPQMSAGSDERVWRYLWVIPGTFCAVYYYCIFSAGGSARFAQSWVRVLVFWLIHMGSLVVLYVLERFLREARENLRLQQQNSQLALQAAQYETLKQNIAHTRRTRHDLRQHILTMQGLIRKENYDALRRYMAQYAQSVPEPMEEAAVFCQNYAINSVLWFYAEKAKAVAEMSVTVRMQQTAIIPEPELCVLLGNLLENAVDACAGQEARGEIRVNMLQNGPSMLALSVDNTCPEPPVWQDGKLRSSKHEGFGTGTQSVMMIAARYHGDARFEWKDGMFYASVLLNP